MTRRDPKVPMRQMLDHARDALQHAQGRSRSDLDTDRELYLVMVYLTETVGRAASRVPQEERTKHSGVDWQQVAALRHLVHQYDRIDNDMIWQTVTEDFPGLVAELERILPPLRS